VPEPLDLTGDVVALTARLVDVPSESHDEGALADLVEQALQAQSHLALRRFGNTIVARTDLGRAERVVLGGHLDTVPFHDNLPHRLTESALYGLGACDMKGGVAVALALAASVPAPVRDATFVFYECEEVEARFNGLGRVLELAPELLQADLAILLEPSNAGIEAGCQGTLRVEARITGQRAHSARSWLGENAIHAAAPLLERLASYVPRRPVIDGLEYREGMTAVGIRGGVAGNVVPDECVVTVNHRFAPDRSEAEALDHVREVLAPFAIELIDSAPAASPGLDRPAAAAFVRAVGADPQPKFGWTDVARFAALGVPAVNYGPGDPALAHTRGEYVPVAQIRECLDRLVAWQRGG
jgi:succinyl-diaminopimelate desuccinylase